MDYLGYRELYHHGIKGQEWGDRNGPPYPLDYEAHTAEQKKLNPKSTIDGDAKTENSKKDKNKKIAIGVGVAASVAAAAGIAWYFGNKNGQKNSVSSKDLEKAKKESYGKGMEAGKTLMKDLQHQEAVERGKKAAATKKANKEKREKSGLALAKGEVPIKDIPKVMDLFVSGGVRK